MFNNSLFFLRLKKIYSILCNFYYLKALVLNRVVAAIEHEKIISIDLQTIIDIGGNKGQFSLVSRFVATDAIIYMYEPLRSPYNVAKKLFKNDTKVNIFNYAIGSFEGECDINVSKNDDSSSIRAITNLQVEIFPGTNKIGIERIKVKGLQKALEKFKLEQPAMLKIDVQGYEFEVLKSGESILSIFKWIYCELSFLELYQKQPLAHQIIQWLSERGFALVGVYNLSNDSRGVAVQADFLFERIGL